MLFYDENLTKDINPFQMRTKSIKNVPPGALKDGQIAVKIKVYVHFSYTKVTDHRLFT